MTDLPPARPAVVLAAVAAGLGGALLATQSRINGELGLRLDDGFVAALVSFVTGLLIMSVAMLVAPSGRRGWTSLVAAVREHRMPWWYLPAGAVGSFVVSLQGLTVAVLGVALFTVATVCGQTVSSLLIDRRGLGAMPPKPLTVARVVGSALAVAAVVWSVSSRVQTDIPIWMLVLPFFAGLAMGWQQAVNGQIRRHASSAVTTTFLNFVVGTIVLLVVVAVHLAVAGPPAAFPTEPWLYAGGLAGVCLVAIGSIVVPISGVLVAGLATIAGQIVTSLLFDLLLPTAGREVVLSTVFGAVLTLIAAAIAVLPSRRLVPASTRQAGDTAPRIRGE